MMRTRRVVVLFLGLCLADQVAMVYLVYLGKDAGFLSTLKPRVNYLVAAQMLDIPFQPEANQSQVKEQVPFLMREFGPTLFATHTESMVVLLQQDPEILIDDQAEEFIITLTFVPSQQDEKTHIGRQTLPDPLLNTEPSLTIDSVVPMRPDGGHPLPTINKIEQSPETINYFIVRDSAK